MKKKTRERGSYNSYTLISNKTESLIYLLNKIAENKNIVLKKEAEYLGVSVRTLQRYIQNIANTGYEISGKKGVYKSEDTLKFPKVNLSNQENTLITVLGTITKHLGKDFNKAFNTLKRRLIIDKNETPFYYHIDKTLKFSFNDIVETICKAIKKRKEIKVTFLNRISETLKPFKIANYVGLWYLISEDEKGNIRKPRINEITNVKLTDKKFTTDTDINTLLEESMNVWFNKKPEIKVKIKANADVAHYFCERQYFPYQTIKNNKDGSLEISCLCSNYEEILFTIMPWIPSISVISPQELEDKIVWRIEEYLKHTKNVNNKE